MSTLPSRRPASSVQRTNDAWARTTDHIVRLFDTTTLQARCAFSLSDCVSRGDRCTISPTAHETRLALVPRNRYARLASARPWTAVLAAIAPRLAKHSRRHERRDARRGSGCRAHALRIDARLSSSFALCNRRDGLKRDDSDACPSIVRALRAPRRWPEAQDERARSYQTGTHSSAELPSVDEDSGALEPETYVPQLPASCARRLASPVRAWTVDLHRHPTTEVPSSSGVATSASTTVRSACAGTGRPVPNSHRAHARHSRSPPIGRLIEMREGAERRTVYRGPTPLLRWLRGLASPARARVGPAPHDSSAVTPGICKAVARTALPNSRRRHSRGSLIGRWSEMEGDGSRAACTRRQFDSRAGGRRREKSGRESRGRDFAPWTRCSSLEVAVDATRLNRRKGLACTVEMWFESLGTAHEIIRHALARAGTSNSYVPSSVGDLRYTVHRRHAHWCSLSVDGRHCDLLAFTGGDEDTTTLYRSVCLLVAPLPLAAFALALALAKQAKLANSRSLAPGPTRGVLVSGCADFPSPAARDFRWVGFCACDDLRADTVHASRAYLRDGTKVEPLEYRSVQDQRLWYKINGFGTGPSRLGSSFRTRSRVRYQTLSTKRAVAAQYVYSYGSHSGAKFSRSPAYVLTPFLPPRSPLYAILVLSPCDDVSLACTPAHGAQSPARRLPREAWTRRPRDVVEDRSRTLSM
ncbi:hypothetical protein C8Q76DRAFT_699156, partial [Earliella scabrosa]